MEMAHAAAANLLDNGLPMHAHRIFSSELRDHLRLVE